MKTQQSLPESADPPNLAKKYRTSLSVVQGRLIRVRRAFEELAAKLAVVPGNDDKSEQDDKDRKMQNPLVEFDKPSDVVNDTSLSASEKKKALENLEQDAQQLLTASMAPQSDHLRKYEPKLDEVVKAKDQIGEKPRPKPAQ